MASMIHELADTAAWAPGVWADPHKVLWYATDWRVSNQKFTFRRNPGARNSYLSVTFTNARWDPEHSDISYGDKKVAQNVIVVNNAKTKVIRNDSDAVVHVTYEESEELTNSFSTSITHGLTLDMTVSSETSVSGSYAGISAEEKITAEFGVETTSEESREKSEEGTKTEKIGIEFDAAPREYYLVTITKEHETTYQDFTIDGVMDFDIRIDLAGQHGGLLRSHYPGDTVSVTGISGFEQFVYGFDTDYPAMQGFYDAAFSRTRNGIACVLNSGRR